jgi:class 3 adenylate cyclase
MGSIYILILIFNFIYFIFHKSVVIFLVFSAGEFILFAGVSMLSGYYLYKPIQEMFDSNLESSKAIQRINHLSLYSSLVILSIGIFHVMIILIPLVFLPHLFQNPEDFQLENLPLEFVLNSVVPSQGFIFAIFPAFINYYTINDFVIELKKQASLQFGIEFEAKKNRIWLSLVFVFICLVILPSLLVMLELKVAYDIRDKYSKFTTQSPLETVMIDRFVLFVGMIISIYLITRAFTRPIDILLKAISKVSDGDYTTQAAIVTSDEIGVLTREFNHMVKGLKEKEVIRDTFGKYVTKDVANFILQNHINLEGEVRECTILVTDIANYTTISESLSPSEIVKMLNEYFSELVEIIQKNKGVVNKYIGDSIFAIFNVPLNDPEHSLNAIRASIEIQTITKSKTFGNHKILETRIGVNTGEVVAGNIGSHDRIEYTVIGDEVNIASRLEQLNKEYGIKILLGEKTYIQVAKEFNCKEIGTVQLKGKEKSIKVYEILS